MYAICGATGNVGRFIAESLLNQGKPVRAIGRSEERLQTLVDMGAEPFVGDLRDTKAMAEAFSGTRAVFVMIPPDLTTPDISTYQKEIGTSITKAIKVSGVTHVVNLSSVGAHMTTGVGVVNGLHDQEERLNKLTGISVIHLRPALFMENHLWQIDTIKQNGMMATPAELNIPLAQITTTDIADYAVDRLTKLDFEGKVTRELLGPADVSFNQVAAAIGHALGRDNLKYQHVSYEDARKSMLGTGVSGSVADGMIELYRAVNDGSCRPTETRSPDNTTPTTIDSFSRFFAQVYNA